MSVAETMRSKIEKALAPLQLEIEDESHKHAGHSGAREGGETHFRLTIVSAAFEGQTRVARHRSVTSILKDEIGNPVHALALKTLTPEEARKEAAAG